MKEKWSENCIQETFLGEKKPVTAFCDDFCFDFDCKAIDGSLSGKSLRKFSQKISQKMKSVPHLSNDSNIILEDIFLFHFFSF